MPPNVVKQTAKTTTNGPIRTSKSDSILDEAIPVSELDDDFIHMLLYGRNRVGKTTLACKFPKPLLLIAVEPTLTGGAKSVKNVPGVKYLRLSESERVKRLGYELKEDLKGIKTVVVDSGSSLDEILLAEICGWEQTAEMLRWPKKGETPKVSQDEYTERSEKMRQVLRPYLELRSHVLILANEKDHNPPEGRKSAIVKGIQAESFFSAAMGGGTTRWLQDGCDYICQLLIEKEYREKVRTINGQKVTSMEETGKMIRRLRTQYHTNFMAGFRSSTPENVPEFIDNPDYEKIKTAIYGE